jgi:hypothetical protein
MGRWKLSLYSRIFADLRAMRRNIVGTEFFKNQKTAGWLPTAGQTHAPLPASNTSEITQPDPVFEASVVNPELDRKYGLLIRMQADKKNYAKNNEKTYCFSKLMCSHGALEAFPLF